MQLIDIANTNGQFYAPRFEVEIEGQKLKGSMERIITDISVTEKVDEGASFVFTIFDEYDLKEQKFKWLEHDLFQVGNRITIRFGYENDLYTLIQGSITTVEPSFFAGEVPTIAIAGHDLSFGWLKTPSPSKTFKDMTYSEIAEDIAREAKLSAVVDRTDIKIKEIKKPNNEPYYLFLKKLAEQIEYVFFVYKQTMYFVKEYVYPSEEVSLSLGRDLISFKPTLNTAGVLKKVEVRGHNPMDPSHPITVQMQSTEGLIRDGYIKIGPLSKKIEGSSEKVIDNLIVTSRAHAEKIARAVLARANENILVGEGSAIGMPQLRAGMILKLERLGSIFSGKYYVKEVTHTINTSGYITKFSVRRSQT